MSPFFFFTLSLCFSLSLHSDCTSQAETLSVSVSCSLWNSHKMAKNCSLFQLFSLGRMALVSFFPFPSTCPTCLASLLIKRSQTSPTLWSFLNKWKSCFEDFWNKLINELWQRCVLESKGVTCTQHLFYLKIYDFNCLLQGPSFILHKLYNTEGPNWSTFGRHRPLVATSCSCWCGAQTRCQCLKEVGSMHSVGASSMQPSNLDSLIRDKPVIADLNITSVSEIQDTPMSPPKNYHKRYGWWGVILSPSWH